DRARRLEGQELERQCGALHHLAPAAPVARLRQPAAPVDASRAECRLRLDFRHAARGEVARAAPHEEGRALAFAERDGRVGVAVAEVERRRPGEREGEAPTEEDDALLVDAEPVLLARVVEPWSGLDLKLHLAAHA